MEAILRIAENIQTPLSIGALAVLCFFGLFKLIIDKLPIEKMIKKDTYDILKYSIKLIFAISLIGLVLGILLHGLTTVLNWSNEKRIQVSLEKLETLSSENREAIIRNAIGFRYYNQNSISGHCSIIATMVRNSPNMSNDFTRARVDVQAAVEYLSYNIKNKKCSNVDLTGSDLRRLILPDGDLSTSIMTESKLQEANFRGAKFYDARLIGANLSGASLRQARLRGAYLNGATWAGVILTDADLTHAKGLAGADLKTVLMDRAVLDSVDLRGAKFSMHSVRGISLKGADLRGADLSLVKGICKESYKEAMIDNDTKPPETYEC
ncbi:pentapeptide repeat-containing protein [Bosea sp. WAO]|uniref:pentapeptide repeat-containing protein n=1 Tax=Bosea sp. WAO TaxID=406341 RepID=UPI0009F99446|nr:pentapeptide repeat-containing protein [Bosea sp. WAO]